MRWLKPLVSLGLLVAAAGIALAVGLSNHSADFGKVPLPQGGMVHLPKGKVTVFYSQPSQSSAPAEVNTPLSYEVVSPSGVPVPLASENGAPPADAVQRSETIGELGAIAKLDVPASGDYVVRASSGAAPGTTALEFGTNAAAALRSKWQLLAGLVIGAILVALIPVRKHKRRWEDEVGPPTGWSSDPRAPYAG
jgi:hypothetical protein